jgi:hypothetical protein
LIALVCFSVTCLPPWCIVKMLLHNVYTSLYIHQFHH